MRLALLLGIGLVGVHACSDPSDVPRGAPAAGGTHSDASQGGSTLEGGVAGASGAKDASTGGAGGVGAAGGGKDSGQLEGSAETSLGGSAGSAGVPSDSGVAGEGGAVEAGAGSAGAPWIPGAIVQTALPPKSELLALPGGGVGNPVVTSNNPEIAEGKGLLYGTGHPSPARGGATYPLSGDFGVYFHHLNQAQTTLQLTVLVTNPGPSAVTVSAEGSGYSQSETGGLGLGKSPDYRVSKEWIEQEPGTVVAPATIAPFKPLVVFRKPVSSGAEIDGRLAVHASGPVYCYVVLTATTDVNEAVNLSQTDAPGDIAVSGKPPPPFGREAGVYAFDTWEGTIEAQIPEGANHQGFMVNTATGGGLPQIQAFPALTHYNDSAAEAVGMYGNVYRLHVKLSSPSNATSNRSARVWFASLASGNPSRFWDGVGLVDGSSVVLRHTPQSRVTLLKEVTLAPGSEQTVELAAMVPGLASIPQALWLESF